jgi:hypothetical protein
MGKKPIQLGSCDKANLHKHAQKQSKLQITIALKTLHSATDDYTYFDQSGQLQPEVTDNYYISIFYDSYKTILFWPN